MRGPFVLLAACVPCALFAQQGGAEFQKTALPFFTKNCISCHSDKLRTANLTLERYPPDAALRATILDKIATGRMPPPGLPRPSKEDAAAMTAWLEKTLGATVAGSLTAHRLNRVEYNNTIHDLLGVSLRPADEFPLDDSGYGFDNIGDVLSLSPLLMEKYEAAARAVSSAAVYGEPVQAAPTKLIRLLGKKSQDDPTANALPYSHRGALWASFDFPRTGEYEFRMRVGNYRPRAGAPGRRTPEENRKSYPAVKMSMTLDGQEILTEIVEGDIDYQYAHGESIARRKIQAGEHSFRASFPEFAALPSPRLNVNNDGRRKLFIDYIDIVGPFNPSPDPPPGRARIFVCGGKTAACAKTIVETLASRAWRRPVTARESEELTQLAAAVRAKSGSFDEGIRVVLQAVLVSPNFLFRMEGGAGDYDLASRLSYFLWSTMPDEELLRAAKERTLSQPGALEARARRMLADPRADALVENFAGQWLGLRLLDRKKPDPAHFPLVDDELLDSMRRETTLFTRAIMREDRSVLDFLDGRFTFVNGPLALHYGISGVTGEGFERVELDGQTRGGVVTQGAVLTLSSYATRTSPVIRGKWVLENLLGSAPPPPPPDVPALVETNIGKTVSLRQRLEEHRANAACAVCHNQMDPIGFGLENYDAAGAWREAEGKFPIDSSGTLPGGESFRGPMELKKVLAAEPGLFARNLTEKMLTYALGRGLESYDRAAVDEIDRRLAADGYRFSTMVTEIVKSQTFRGSKKTGVDDAR